MYTTCVMARRKRRVTRRERIMEEHVAQRADQQNERRGRARCSKKTAAERMKWRKWRA